MTPFSLPVSSPGGIFPEAAPSRFSLGEHDSDGGGSGPRCDGGADRADSAQSCGGGPRKSGQAGAGCCGLGCRHLRGGRTQTYRLLREVLEADSTGQHGLEQDPVCVPD